MSKAIVIDLDGALCDISHRESLIGEWDQFNAMCFEDAVHKDVASFLRAIDSAFDRPLLIGCTGRSEKYRIATERWLLENGCLLDFVLMRSEFDFRPDAEVKLQLLQQWHDSTKEAEIGITLQDRVLFILEDRDKVVEAWRGAGFNCWQVREGAF